jgi:uncharacterized repeat protein (TIGR01451 family)
MRKHMAKALTALAALAVASPATLAVSGGPASAAASPTGGEVHLYYADTALDANSATVILTGAITDSGTDCQGCAGPGLNVFKLSKGTFEINVNQLAGEMPVNPATCSSEGPAAGPVPIVPNSIWDTGAYTDIRGTFNTSDAAAAIYPRGQNGQCDSNAKHFPGVLIARGAGTVSYSSTPASADLAVSVYPVNGRALPNYPPRPYSTAIFTVTVTNHGPNTAANVTVTNTVGFATLAGITATPTTVTCRVSTGRCTEPRLRSGASITIKVTVHYKEVIHNMLFCDTAKASSTTPDHNTANNSATGCYAID